jgi:hypothetical protein
VKRLIPFLNENAGVHRCLVSCATLVLILASASLPACIRDYNDFSQSNDVHAETSKSDVVDIRSDLTRKPDNSAGDVDGGRKADVCIPSCFTPEGGIAECGDDGCGGSCGECTGCALVCSGGKCAASPEADWECHNDDIFYMDSCGAWGQKKEDCGAAGCNAGSKVCADCEDVCSDIECGTQSGCDCGTCPEGKSCDGGQCVVKCGDEQCGSAETQCSCPADCKSGCACCDGNDCVADTSDEQCGKGAEVCIECTGQDKCVKGACVCLPACAGGKECGSDGCGGSCGTCEAGKNCEGAQCVVKCGDEQCGAGENKCNCPADCTGGCAGCCAGAVCKTGDLNWECGTGASVCTECTGQEKCAGGECECLPECAGKLCGDDGCEGTCGQCDNCSACVAGDCQTDCSCACIDTECGLHQGCDCGSCAPGLECLNYQCRPPSWTDPQSGLTWQVKPTGGLLQWTSAKYHCLGLSLVGGGWRLPNIDELRSLIRGCPSTQVGSDNCSVQDGGCLDSPCSAQGLCEPCPEGDGPAEGYYWPDEVVGGNSKYWSSSGVSDVNYSVWTVGFLTGSVEVYSISSVSPVRCVR